jgi:hypothetical protein
MLFQLDKAFVDLGFYRKKYSFTLLSNYLPTKTVVFLGQKKGFWLNKKTTVSFCCLAKKEEPLDQILF